MHLNYENQTPLDNIKVIGDIIFNENITIENIPQEAYEYMINGKSAIEWIMDRYQIKIDKDSQIRNNPHD